MKALVGAFNQEKALVGVIVQPVVEPMEHYTALVLGPGNHNKADQKDADSGGPPCLQSMVQNSKLSYFAKANSFSGETAKCKIFVLSTICRYDGRLCCCVTMLILLMRCGHWTAAASSLINI